jgi:hypothetical protein
MIFARVLGMDGVLEYRVSGPHIGSGGLKPEVSGGNIAISDVSSLRRWGIY